MKPLTRQIQEGVLIWKSDDDAILNSKSEWNMVPIPRIVTEKGLNHEERDLEEKVEKKLREEKERVEKESNKVRKKCGKEKRKKKKDRNKEEEDNRTWSRKDREDQQTSEENKNDCSRFL